MRYRIATFVCLFALVSGWAAAQAPDPHRIYEEKCGACHVAHAGDFVWEALTMTGNTLIGLSSGHPVRAFLQAGHGHLSEAETEALIEQFTLIRRSGQLFRSKCRLCHENAITLARHKLLLTDGALQGRYTDRDIRTFLQGHGRLDPVDIEVILEVLTRALETQEEAE